jgi:hypothetical protein
MSDGQSRSVPGMARLLPLSAAVCALAACGSSSAASSAGASAVHCGPAGAHTVAHSSQARVYAKGDALYGCTGGGHRPLRLGSTGSCLGGTSVGPAAVAGKLAAYAARRCGVDTSTTQVVVMRLTDGHQLSSRKATSGTVGPESLQSVGSIVVTAGGKVAWIASTSSIATHRHSTQVIAASGGTVRVLDAGAGIVAGSLKLHRGTVSWTRDGARHTAALP